MLCRAGFERILAQEASLKVFGASQQASQMRAEVHPGWVRLSLDGRQSGRLDTALIFERQRLPDAHWTPGGDTDALANDLAGHWTALLPASKPWTLHAFAPQPTAHDSLTTQAERLGRAVLRRISADDPARGRCYREPAAPGARPLAHSTDPHVLQACRVEGGAWSSLTPASALADPYPGGVHRMPSDALAPSRSYLKLEEAFDVLGAAPAPNEWAVDLGAAPGGWSYALAKRGARVLAVDRGALKLKGLGQLGGEVTHIREDGLRFRPPRPVHWLVSDMLLPPGQSLVLLRKWMDAGWMRRFVFNLKLPQGDPLAALAPFQHDLEGRPGVRYLLRQLYHDRDEVTLMGELPDAMRQPVHPRGAPRRHRR